MHYRNPAGIYRRIAGCGVSPHVIVPYWLDRSDRAALRAIPPYTELEDGVFATRSPDRPNPIGIGVFDLIHREGNRLFVRGLDALDGNSSARHKTVFGGH